MTRSIIELRGVPATTAPAGQAIDHLVLLDAIRQAVQRSRRALKENGELHAIRDRYASLSVHEIGERVGEHLAHDLMTGVAR